MTFKHKLAKRLALSWRGVIPARATGRSATRAPGARSRRPRFARLEITRSDTRYPLFRNVCGRSARLVLGPRTSQPVTRQGAPA